MRITYRGGGGVRSKLYWYPKLYINIYLLIDGLQKFGHLIGWFKLEVSKLFNQL